MILNLSGGGASLNFKVVGNPQPTNPNQTILWLDTDTPITGWNYSATQPENMVEGEVWIIAGTSSGCAFNALKKNSVIVYPTGAMQYVNGELLELSGKVWLNGEWSGWWDGTIYENGVYYNDIPHTDILGSRDWIRDEATCIRFGYGDGEGGGSARRVFGAIDITGFKTLTVTAACDFYNISSFKVAITNTQNATSGIAQTSSDINYGNSIDLTIDLSGLAIDNPEVYIVVNFYRGETLCHQGVVSRIKLSR